MFSFGKYLKMLRLSKGITKNSLARPIGSSEGGIQNYELDARKPNYEMLQTLADYLGISLDYLTDSADYLQNREGNIKAEELTDVLNLDTNKLKKKTDQE